MQGKERGLRPMEELEDAPSGTPEAFAYQLLTLEGGRDDVLTEGEYGELRSEILGQLTAQGTVLRQWAPALGVCVLASLGVAGLGFFGDPFPFLVGGLFALVVSTVTILVLSRTERGPAGLSEADRLLVVQSLVGWELISEQEANDLRAGIHRLERRRPVG